jgi:hypothetical protein
MLEVYRRWLAAKEDPAIPEQRPSPREDTGRPGLVGAPSVVEIVISSLVLWGILLVSMTIWSGLQPSWP